MKTRRFHSKSSVRPPINYFANQMAMLYVVIAALCLGVAGASIVGELERLHELFEIKALSSVQYEAAKDEVIRQSASGGVLGSPALKTELTSLVEKVLLSPKMTTMFATMIAGVTSSAATARRQQEESSEEQQGAMLAGANMEACQTCFWSSALLHTYSPDPHSC